MMRFVSNAFSAIRDELDSWGMKLPSASQARGPRVRVFLDMTSQGQPDVLVGILSQEDHQFVFRYDPEYARRPDARPISAFPDLQDEYRAKYLWPFFAARIPPLERNDIRIEMSKAHLRPDDTLRILATLSRKTITNPYRLELAEV